ncbi:MAG: VWA domain-containing protein [Bacteroidetes bacterium]|nr:VWA domain-containing protein [Bacteroidota bacterium]
MTFAHPVFFWLFGVIPLMVVWYWFKNRKNQAEIKLSSFEPFENVHITVRQRMRHLPFILRLLTVGLMIVALARPQSSSSRHDVNVEGIDIVLANDISGSMLAEDFKPNRLDAAKKVATEFIEGRPTDRIGLVVFSGESFTQCPLTTDHAVLLSMLPKIESGMIQDGTAIGDGLATAVARLKESKAISRVIILLTDGINNMGSIDPASAAEIAKMYKIRVYTIGVGTKGTAPYPFKTPFGVQYQNIEVKIDEDLLQQIAQNTGGKYFRATNNEKLESIYKEIDSLEKSRIEVMEFRKKYEEYLPLVLLAFGILFLEGVLRNTWLKTVP